MYKFFLTDSPTPKYETQQKSMFKTLLGGNVLNPLLPNMQGCEVKSHVLESEWVFKTAGVGVCFFKLLESGFQNCWSRVFKTVGVGFSKLLESGFQNCWSRVFKTVGVGFSKLLESGVGTFVAITDSNVY